MSSYENLGELRDRMMGLSRSFVARSTGLDEERLAALEAGDPPTMAELEHLERLYGIDSDVLAEEPIEVPASDAVSALALLDEFREVSPLTKTQLLRAARAARDVVELRAIVDRAQSYERLMSRTRPRPPRPGRRPHEQGADWAHGWRKRLGVGDRRLKSVRRLLLDHFPEIAVLHLDLGDPTICGVSFADANRGPAIVLNTRGKNENPLVRRFSALHELAHLLIDAQRGTPLATISGFLSEAQLEVEQRANAFAVRFLCTERSLRRLVDDADDWADAMRRLQRRYGLHFKCARLYLQVQGGLEPPEDEDQEALWAQLGEWAAAEDWGLDRLPLDSIPSERRTDVARLASLAYSRGRIGRDRYARLLGVTPAEEVERVLDYFSLDRPEDRAG